MWKAGGVAVDVIVSIRRIESDNCIV
jgi:hypothetical protein